MRSSGSRGVECAGPERPGRHGRERETVSELWEYDAWELAEGVRAGELKAVELLDVFLARVERFNEELNAFCFLDVDDARCRASAVDAAVARGEDPGVW